MQYTIAIVTAYVTMSGNQELINWGTTSNIQNTTHTNNMVTGYNTIYKS